MPSLFAKCSKCGGALTFCQVKIRKHVHYYQYCVTCPRRLGDPVARYIVQRSGFNPAALPTVPLDNSRRVKKLPVRTLPVQRAAPVPLDVQAVRGLPYEEYLKLPHWANMRKAALERAAGRCQLCNSDKALQVHHRTYERLGCELPSDLTVLCRECHGRYHGK